MTISRRSFLKGALAAPAIVTAANLMPLWIPKHAGKIITPTINTSGMLVFLNGVLQEQSKEWIVQPGYHLQMINPVTKEHTYYRL